LSLRPYIASPMDQKNIDKRLTEVRELYKGKANDLQKAFVILIGFGLFFFFMILFPYFSLKYDSTSLSHIGWLKGDLSEIVSSVDSIVNESRTITNNLQVYTTARSKYDLDRDNYNTQLDRIQYLRENLNMTVANPVVQNILQSLQLYPKCINDTFGTERWRQCNSDSQYNSTTPQLDLIFKSQFKLINESNTKITETAGRINSKITKIDEQIGKPGDIPSYKNIVENYLVI